MTDQSSTALAKVEAPKSAPLTETVSAAVAAQARAAVEARYLVALQRPRDWMDVRSKLLGACKRPGFAATARYRKPIGKGSVDGASIRFAEEAMRAMTNVYVEIAVVYDDADQRIVRVTCTDLENNVSYPTDLHIAKTIERKFVREGQEVIGSRANTQGQTVYVVRATEDDLVTKQAALVSKAIRTNGLRLLPSDIHEEAMEACKATEAAEDTKDPKAALKKMCDAYDSIAVRPSDIARFLGHPLEQTTPAEIRRLREFWRAIQEGEATWQDIVATAGKGVEKAPTKGADALKAKMAGKPRADADGVVDEAGANLALDQELVESERAAEREGK